MTNPPSIAGQDSLEGLANDVRLISDDLITLPVPKARLREAADTIVRLSDALEDISKRCPPFDGDLYVTPSDFNNSEDYATHVDKVICAGIGDTARAALTTTKIEKDA